MSLKNIQTKGKIEPQIKYPHGLDETSQLLYIDDNIDSRDLDWKVKV